MTFTGLENGGTFTDKNHHFLVLLAHFQLGLLFGQRRERRDGNPFIRYLMADCRQHTSLRRKENKKTPLLYPLSFVLCPPFFFSLYLQLIIQTELLGK